MPSGAKKRKAAKKKQASSNSNSAPPPSSTTHSQSGDDDLKHHDGRDSDGEDLEKRDDSSSDQSFVSKGKFIQDESTGKGDDEEGIVQIDWDLKPEEDYESSDIATGSKKKSDDGSSSGSSSSGSSRSSSSDDESHVVEKKIVVVEDAPTTVDLVEPLDFSPEKVTQVVDDLVKPIDSLSEGVDNLGVHVVESVSIESCSSSHVAETFRKVNDIKKLPLLDKNSEISSIMMDLESKSEDEEKKMTSVEDDAKIFVAKETDANPSRVGGNAEESDSQPHVASAPRIVQMTSWKSCCGIFELFAGSNR